VGFAAGTGFGLVVLSDDGGAADEAAVDRRDTSDFDPGHGPGRSGDDVGAGRRRGVSSDGVMVENAMRGEVTVPTTGTGVITGSVSDESGAPVAGVEISAKTDVWSLTETPAGLVEEDASTLEARIRSVVREYRFEEATRREVTTGADGSYRLEGLVDATFSLSASKAGYTFRTAGGAEWTAKPGERRDWVASPVMAVVVVAALPDGSEPESITVEYVDHAANSTYTEHLDKGDDPLELAPGEYEFTVSAGEGLRYRADAVQVVVNEGAATRVEVALKIRPGVTGSVTFGGEEPTVVGVAALRVGDGIDAVPEQLMAAPHIAWVEPPFDYAHFDLPPGAYLLGTALRNGRVLESRMIEIGTDLLEEDFAIGNVDVRDYTVVRVRGPGGQTVREVTFSVGYEAENVSFEGNFEAARQADGSYRVPHTVPGSPQTGFQGWSSSGDSSAGVQHANLKSHIVVMSPQFGRKRVDFDPLSQPELEIEFGEPAFAVVSVSGYAESEWRGRVQASIRTAGDSPGTGMWVSGEQHKMSPQGVARVGPVEPGSYAVVLMVNTPESGFKEVGQQEVTLGVGDTPLTMSIPDLHRLTVECEGAALDLDLHRDPGPNQSTDFMGGGVRDGQLTHFHAVVPGRYRVRAYGEGSPGEMLVDVPTGGTVMFRPVPYDSMRVDHVSEDLEGHLQRGDVILEIGGRALEGEAGIRAAVALAQADENVQLVVRRGASNVDVTLPSRLLESGQLTNWTR
jgi:hypothetical protein